MVHTVQLCGTSGRAKFLLCEDLLKDPAEFNRKKEDAARKSSESPVNQTQRPHEVVIR